MPRVLYFYRRDKYIYRSLRGVKHPTPPHSTPKQKLAIQLRLFYGTFLLIIVVIRERLA
jgi:hypothetical protein